MPTAPPLPLSPTTKHHERLRAIIAIDFGHTGSGFSWAFFGDKKVEYNTIWPDAVRGRQPKTKTALLYKANDLIAWGEGAEAELYRQLEQGGTGYVFCDKFKLSLHNGTPTPEGPLRIIGTKPQKSRNVVDLVTDYLRCIKVHAVDTINSTGTGDIDENDVLWCLTVPAIWTEDDKHWMRVAAERAGLVSSGHSDRDRLRLVLEPEAAALYCQHRDTGTGISKLAAGTTYMLVDAGGGTVDITVHTGV